VRAVPDQYPQLFADQLEAFLNGGHATHLGRAQANVDRVTASSSRTLTAVGDGDHVTGSHAPELTLVEYGDFGCPFCFAASRPVQSLLNRFDSLRLVLATLSRRRPTSRRRAPQADRAGRARATPTVFYSGAGPTISRPNLAGSESLSSRGTRKYSKPAGSKMSRIRADSPLTVSPWERFLGRAA